MKSNKYYFYRYLLLTFTIFFVICSCFILLQNTEKGFPPKAHAASPNIYFNGPITGSIYSANVSSTTFTATLQSPVLFTQTFPDIAFNGFSPEASCSNQPNTNSSDRPMIDRILLSNGSCNIITVQGNGYQAGFGSLSAFDMVLTGSFSVDGAGSIPLKVNHDDGWFLGIGPSNGQQPSYSSGDMTNTPARTPFKNYQVVAGYNDDKVGAPNNTKVNFPAAGVYPFELDYFEVNNGTLYLILNQNTQAIIQAPSPTSAPTPTPIPTYTISGNVFIDTNKNKLKDGGESNYAAAPSITATKGTITTNANGSYTISNITAGQVIVNYASLPANYYMTSPLNGPPPSFTVTVGQGCTVNGAPGVSCTNGNITNLNFGISNTYPWVQAVCGDIRDDAGITDLLPAGQVAISTAASCPVAAIGFSGDTDPNFGQGQVSTSKQIVGGTAYPESFSDASPLATSYPALLSKAQAANITPTSMGTICALTTCTLPANLPHGIYQVNGDMTIANNTYTFANNANYIFLINGNLTLNGKITVPSGSTVLFATTKNIIVSPTVGSAVNSTVSSLDGWYVAGQNFIVNSQGNCNDLRLNIGGSVVVNALGNGGSLQNNRDLCGNDAADPAITVTQRLDMLLNAPTFIKQQLTISQELEP